MKENNSERIAELTNAIVAGSSDKSAAKKLVDNLLTEYTAKIVRPVELEILEEDVIKRYDLGGAAELVKTDKAIFFHTTCFWVVSKPTLANNLKGGALYEMLSFICEYLDEREQYDDDRKEMYDTLVSMMGHLFTIPLDVFTDSEFMVDIADYVITKRAEYYTRIAEEAAKENPETMEDHMALQEMAEELEMGEGIMSDLGRMKEKRMS